MSYQQMIGWWASDKVSLLVLFLMARSYLLGAIELAEGVMLLMITTALQYWSKAINDAVPLPYLDEVFHVRQAWHYWKGEWSVWDPKITTPPGLYLLSWPLLTAEHWFDPSAFFLNIARSTNRLCIILLAMSLHRSLKLSGLTNSVKAVHGALNLILFPPLFFFSALYYTDVPSVLSVVAVHIAFEMQRPLHVVVLGLVSLLFRQTNIFWVAIYLGGREALRTLRKGRKAEGFSSDSGFIGIAQASWSHRSLHDPYVREAWFEGKYYTKLRTWNGAYGGVDYPKTILSLVFAVLAEARELIVPLIPYISLLGAFGAFVLCNGGVVLGDKDNHIASIHLTQMLYIWPYIAFFSFPILLPTLIPSLLALLPSRISSHLPPILRPFTSARSPTPRLIVSVPLLAIALLTIHYNTLIHPFTLADNRHYTFYVFRLLTRHAWTKYLVAPLYIVFGWACISALGGTRAVTQLTPKSKQTGQDNRLAARDGESRETEEHGTRVSAVLLWLLASTLSLASTPLVEPRYFILPWLFWRLMVPTSNVAKTRLSDMGSKERASTPKNWTEAIIDEAKDSYALSLETLWFVAVNVATGYIFLYWGFEWPSEPGSVQRFMW